jgi:xanthine dehydrogenase YagS FAD-binding subunit
MNRFELARPHSTAQARELLAEKPGSMLKAGGIDLIDHLKERLVEPARVVDLKSVPGLDRIVADPDGGLRIGPLATLARVAADETVRRTHPALAQACGEAASPQIRNVATIGGNLLQRPRCWYYRLENYRCIKKGGEICYAVDGENRYHVIFGGGPVFAVHPSNAAVPLVAYGASFTLESDKGVRTVPSAEFFRLPSEDPQRENQLRPGEVLTEIRLPAAAGARGAYDDVREKAAFDWPLVSTAIVLGLDGGTVKSARVVLGAVAPIPWRAEKAEQVLLGRRLDEPAAEQAARAAVAGAEPLSQNGYKVALVQALVKRTLLALKV